MGLKRELSAWEKINDDNDDLENEEKVKFDAKVQYGYYWRYENRENIW